MKLWTCYGPLPPSSHPCRKAYDALREAGHDPEIARGLGSRLLPFFPFNLKRRRVKELTGKLDVPMLEVGDGTVVQGTREIVAWARANPAR